MSEDLLTFDDEPADPPPADTAVPWKILIVDDDDGVHSSTRFALDRVQVEGRPLTILNAYSAGEAQQMFGEHPDIALALVDVVMETDHAGLDFVRWVRDELGNHAVRLVLRTGQPGQAPERDVVVNFDIDDYKTKSELTAQKLFTLLHAALRSYQHIRALERSLGGLRKVLDASSSLFSAESARRFANGVLEQLTALLNLDPESVVCQTRGLATALHDSRLEIIAGSGGFEGMVGADAYQVLSDEAREMLAEALASRGSVFRSHACATYFSGVDHLAALLFFTASRELTPSDRELILLFTSNIGRAFVCLLKQENG
jgi:CheY-like chemotaxis protein